MKPVGWRELARTPRWEGAARSVGLHLLLLTAIVGAPLAWERSQVRLPVTDALMVELAAMPARTRKEAALKPERLKALAAARIKATTKAKADHTAAKADSRRRDENSGRGGVREETVTLASGGKYRGYLRHIKARIEQGWETAEGARGGKLVLLFSVERSGRVSRVELLASSGDAGLDRSALAAVRRVSPFDPMPRGMDLSRLNVKAGFCYRVAAQ